jgi:hypothetical protein
MVGSAAPSSASRFRREDDASCAGRRCDQYASPMHTAYMAYSAVDPSVRTKPFQLLAVEKALFFFFDFL